MIKPNHPSIEKLFERMADTQSLDEFIDVELELMEEVHAHNLSKGDFVCSTILIYIL